MKRLSLLDTCFLRMETVETPMHVGALLTFRLPRKGRQGYLGQLVRRMRSYPVSRAPFNYVLDRGLAFGLIPSWKIADSVDLDYHFRHSALPRPGGERELGVLISRLHSHPLDMSRPPWECHVIEGLESDRFAIYLKGHHAAIDGMGGLRLIKSWLSESGDDMETPPPWALPASTSLKLPDQRHLYALKHRIKALRTQLGAVTELVLSVRRAPSEYPNGSIATLFKAPHCALNVPISGARRFATQMLSLERIKSVAQQTGTSVNDVVLTIAGGALRRYLIELDALPRLSLLALVPVALRPRRNQTNGNSLCGLLTDLETQIADPVERLCTISASTQAGKRHVQRLSPAAAAQYSMLLMAPLTLSQISGLGSNLPPLFNLLVSNVPAARILESITTYGHFTKE
jgi:WS/DGAT/MGAT family acyltransferase